MILASKMFVISQIHTQHFMHYVAVFSLQAAISRDEAFTQTVWVRRDQMSPDELQRLLSEHFNDVSNLRRMRNNENDRLADNLKNKLSLKGAPDAGDESDSDPDGRDSDVGEATAVSVNITSIDVTTLQ